MRRLDRSLLIPLLLYAGMSLFTLTVWALRGVYGLTGDEPHYLLIADAFLRHGTLELRQPYLDEFASPTLYPLGLAPPGTEPQSPFAHVFVGSNGLYSWHGLGVPFLVAIPLALAGVVGAKLTMIALGALAVVLAWRIACLLFEAGRARTLSVLVVAIGYPLIPASNQVFPDLVAGILCLAVVYLLMSPDAPRRRVSLAGYGFLIGYLPWLGIKFTVASVALLIVAVASLWRRSRRDAAWLALPAIALYLLLAGFNAFAYQSVAGPPAEGALEASATSLMVTWGLLFDQDQGILLQNPALWLGLLGLADFVRRFRWGALAWALAFVGIWIPGGAHTGWYGLGGFVGRYSWALAILAIAPALVGLARLREWSRRGFGVVAPIAIAINVAFIALHTLTGGSTPGRVLGIDLYTKPPSTWLESYAAFWFPLQDWFPALYDTDWAFGFWPNWAWLVVAAGVLIAGVRMKPGAIVAAVGIVLVAVSGFLSTPGPRAEVLAVDQTRTADGYFDAGLPRQMRLGPYTWSVAYSSDQPATAVAGRWELVPAGSEVPVAAGELPGTDGATVTVPVTIPFRALNPQEFVLRVASYGGGAMTLDSLGVAHGDAVAPSDGSR